jgi:pentatricopeptide repeat protein
LKQGGDEATVAARSMMDKMVKHGVADLYSFNVMLKFSKGSGEMREVIDVMIAKAKLKPDVVTYNTLVGRLRMEDDDAAAESVVEEMKKAGVEPNGRTLEMLNLPSRGENLSKMRNSKLSQFLKQGGDEAAVAARSMMDKMVEHGVADLPSFTLMLKFCKSSGEMREVIDVTMAKAKSKPDVGTYNMLVGRLRMEGNDAAAESVVEEMKKAGVEPDERTHEILNLPSRGENLSKMRTSKLSHLGSDGASQEVEDGGLSEEEDPKEDLSKFTVLQLKDMLRGKGLGVSGRKAELMRRLEEAE